MAKFGKGTSWLLLSSATMLMGASVSGGIIDMANNTRYVSTEGSNPDIVQQYQQQIAALSVEKTTVENGALAARTENFFSSVYTATQLSELDVRNLTQEFGEAIADPAILVPGLMLDHPEYLNECKQGTNASDLGVLDQCTRSKHEEAISDGPWMGAVVGAVTGFYVLGSPALLLLYLLMRGGGTVLDDMERSMKGAKRAGKRKSKYGIH